MIIAFLLLGAACCIQADQLRPEIPAQLAATPPKIDGILDDTCWKAAPSVDKYWLQTDEEAPEKTKSYISYDSKALYVAFYCYDTEPALIQAEQSQRRGPMETDDKIIFYIDALNALQLNQYSRFRVSAGGCMDERIATTQISKPEWQDDWKAASKRVDDGYIVEISIPWKMLQYDYKANHLGVMFSRFIGRSKRFVVSPRIGNNLTPDHWYQWSGLQLPKSVKLPVTKTYELIKANKNFSSIKGGADVLYNPSPTSSLELIVNPDASNIEHYVLHLSPTSQPRVVASMNSAFSEQSIDMLGTDMFSSSRSASAYRSANQLRTDQASLLSDTTGWNDAMQFFGRSSGGSGMHSLKFYDRQKSTDFEIMHSVADNGDNAQLLMLEKEFGAKGSLSGSMVQSKYKNTKGLSTDLNGYLKLYDVGERRLTAYGFLGSADDGSGKGRGQRAETSLNWEAGLGEWKYWYEYSTADDRYDSTALPSVDATLPENDGLIVNRLHGHAGAESDFVRNNAGASIEIQPDDGKFEYWTVSLSRDESQTRSSNELISRDYQGTIEAYLKSGLSLSLDADMMNSPESDDRIITYELGWGNNTLFRNGGISYGNGEVSDGTYHEWEIFQGWNLGSNLHCKLNWSREEISAPSPDKGILTKAVATLVYEFPTASLERSLSGQMVNRGRSTNLYVVYRQKSHKGMSLYMLYGDPRAKRTEETFTLKLVQQF